MFVRSKKALRFWKPTADKVQMLRSSKYRLRRREGARDYDGEGGEMIGVSRDLKMRSCLRCGKQFLSEWSGNRICPRCTKVNSTSRCNMARSRVMPARESVVRE